MDVPGWIGYGPGFDLSLLTLANLERVVGVRGRSVR